MKKKILLTLCALTLMAIAFIVCLHPFGTRPFSKISREDITSASLFLIPPQVTVTLTEEEDFTELAGILKELVIYREDDSGREYNGQLVQVTVTLKDGSTHTIGAYNPFLFLDGKCFRTKYAPCESLNAFENRIIEKSP